MKISNVVKLVGMGLILIASLTIPCAIVRADSNTLVVAQAEFAWEFDVLYSSWGDIARLARVCYDPLLKYDAVSKEVIPWVAKSWEISEDGLAYTFYLNRGIKFHDGTELTASDVKFTVERDRALHGDVAALFTDVATIDIIDDYTITFHLNKPNNEFLLNLSPFYIISEDGVKEHDQGDLARGYLQDHDLGSGPYQVVHHIPEQKTICEKFADYWKGWDGNHIDRIVWLWIGDPAVQRMMLENGEIDVAMNPSLADLPDFENNPDLIIFSDPTHIILKVSFRTIRSPLDDVRVRKALAMAIDYDYHIEVGTGGYGKRANSPVASALPYHNDDIPLVPYDLKAAKQLLAQAGYPDGGFKLVLGYESAQPEKQRLLEMLQQNWGQLGITIEPAGMDYNTQWAMQKDPNSEVDVWLHYIWPAYAAPYQVLKEFYWTPLKGVLGANAAYWSTPEVDNLIEEGLTTRDPARVEECAKEAQRLIVDAQPDAWVCEEAYVMVARNYVKGYIYNPMYHQTLDVYNMWLEGKP